MCLAIPARITRIEGTRAELDVEGTTTSADISMVPKVRVGQYVIVHAGFAIQVYDEREAQETLQAFREIAEAEEEGRT